MGFFLTDAPFRSSGHADGVRFSSSSSTARRSASIQGQEKVTAGGGDDDLSWLAGFTHFRLLPGDFKNGSIPYHFDGLATVLKVEFGAAAAGKLPALKFQNAPFNDKAQVDWDHCTYEATGTTHIGGFTEACLRNPAVNLLPIHGELWLTIDTYLWGRVDPATLATMASAAVDVDGVTLNAHPACDDAADTCYVQHPCPTSNPRLPRTNQACVSRLVKDAAGQGGMKAEILKRVTLPRELIIQHSHEPCITENWLVSKLDSFTFHDPLNHYGGLLKTLEQEEDNLYLLYNRRSNESHVVTGGPKFVNNHFGNCFEDGEGNLVVDSVPATSEYLFSYFASNLAGSANWEKILWPPLRCVFANSSGWTVACDNLLQGADAKLSFDYPTYNPLWKTNPKSRFLYGISQLSLSSSKWFDRVIKMDTQARKVAASWSQPGIYVTEADFIGRPGATAEDDGVLLSLAYNQTSHRSHFLLLDARNLREIATYQLDASYPFHAHGIVCPPKGPCFTNP